MDGLADGCSREQIIRRLYWDEELSQKLIAGRLCCSKALVYKLMKKFQIPSRSHSQAAQVAIKHERIDHDEIHRKAIVTMREEVEKGLRRWNRPGRHKEKISALEEKFGMTYDEILHRLYWEEHLSCRQIAEQLNEMMDEIPGKHFKIGKGAVSRRLRMFDIPRREISEATKIAMGQLPPDKRERRKRVK